MGTKKYKPRTPGTRTRQVLSFEEITSVRPLKSLLGTLNKSSGRNNQGKLTVRHKGGGAKRKYRFIDFKRSKLGVSAKVATIEYDPNRTANIALLIYKDGEKSYILAPSGLAVGDELASGPDVEISLGNCLPLGSIPTGTIIHNIELKPGKGAQLSRAAGSAATLMAKSAKYATIKLPSSEVRLINITCKATIGQLGNQDRRNTVIGKAGSKRHRGVRPTVRGSVMNPCDHPHGGGEGRAPVGRSGPMTPWGKPALGLKTRNPKSRSNRVIIRRRRK